jgi:hypothetical protein
MKWKARIALAAVLTLALVVVVAALAAPAGYRKGAAKAEASNTANSLAIVSGGGNLMPLW